MSGDWVCEECAEPWDHSHHQCQRCGNRTREWRAERDPGEFLELSAADYDILEGIPYCGCGDPGSVWAVYHGVLTATPPSGYHGDWRGHGWEDRVAAAEGNETMCYMASYVLAGIEATEHGTSVHVGWRTEKGERLLAVFERWAASDYEAIPVRRDP